MLPNFAGMKICDCNNKCYRITLTEEMEEEEEEERRSTCSWFPRNYNNIGICEGIICVILREII